VSLDGERVADETQPIGAGLPGGVSIIRRGKKTLAGLVPRG
jgi:tyrosyl-tRNA synthetase